MTEKKLKAGKYSQTITRLMNETRNVYQSAGKELSQERLAEMMSDLLDQMWPLYLTKELADACDIPRQCVDSMAGIDKTSENDNDEE